MCLNTGSISSSNCEVMLSLLDWNILVVHGTSFWDGECWAVLRTFSCSGHCFTGRCGFLCVCVHALTWASGSSTAGQRALRCSLACVRSVCLIIQHTWAVTHLAYQLLFGHQSVEVLLPPPSLTPFSVTASYHQDIVHFTSSHFTPSSSCRTYLKSSRCGPGAEAWMFSISFTTKSFFFPLISFTQQPHKDVNSTTCFNYSALSDSWQLYYL